MLRSLTVTNFVLVEQQELVLDPGFSVLTGETGAGKSILLDALGLALGERADPQAVREGASRADISAEFSLANVPTLRHWLEENDLQGDEETLLLRRVVESSGRTRGYINGHPVTLQQLKDAGEHLVDIHGQHAHYSLLRPQVQRQLLDGYAEAGELSRQVAAAYRSWQQAVRRRREAEVQATSDAGERDQLRGVVEELTALDFRAEEWEELQESHRRLAHAAELISGVQAVSTLMDADGEGILALLASARSRLNDLVPYDAHLLDPHQALEDVLIQLQETVRDLNRYAEGVELDPAALARAEARIAQVTDVARKLRARPEELDAVLASSRSHLDELDRNRDLEALARAASEAEAAYLCLAQELSARRREAGARLAGAATSAMQGLAMKGGTFDVALHPCTPEAGGLEEVEFLVSPHPEQALRPLTKTASGGELSRLGLALQTVLSSQSGAGTLIFDEVDAGVGGGVAEVVGRMLSSLGRDRQVLCVTHLAQVAARADRHWRVSKRVVDGHHLLTRVERLESGQRVEEIARMLGGVKITDTTRRHAREMLETA